MPISEYPFLRMAPGQPPRPMLPIRIFNPATGQSIISLGLIDTGADDCAIPASYADLLGHQLTAGSIKRVSTGNGITNAYAHSTRIDILRVDGEMPDISTVVHTIPDTPIDFMPNLNMILLGVNSFLSRFKLVIDYPALRFSIKEPGK